MHLSNVLDERVPYCMCVQYWLWVGFSCSVCICKPKFFWKRFLGYTQANKMHTVSVLFDFQWFFFRTAIFLLHNKPKQNYRVLLCFVIACARAEKGSITGLSIESKDLIFCRAKRKYFRSKTPNIPGRISETRSKYGPKTVHTSNHCS